MKLIKKIKRILISLKNSYRRFPITIAFSTALVIMLIVLVERGPNLSAEAREALERINMVIALGIPLSLCIKLIFEKKKIYNKLYQGLGYILGLGILVLYYFLLLKELNMISIVRYIGVSLFLYLAFIYIPWINRKDGLEDYVIKLLFDFFITGVYSLVLYLGISAIIFTINQLFNANIPGKFFYYAFLVVAGIFAPSLFLARIPEMDEDLNKEEYPKSLKVLLLYIVIPLITIYSSILYAYFLKIIITRDWPQGLVSHLVLWYSTISVTVIFFITPLLDQNKWANRFKRWFPKYIIPILIMMFISIGIRVRAYGITENRYFVIVLGLWVFGIMLYFGFTKKLNNIVIPVSLSIIALNSVFGPLSSFSIAKLSQNKRLEGILIRNNMIKDNSLIKAPEDISYDDKGEISAILDYFNRNHSLKEVKYLPENFKIDDMQTVFGFPYTEKNKYRNKYFHYALEERNKALDISEYDYLLKGYNIGNAIKLDDNILVSYNEGDFKFIIKEGDNIIYEGDLNKYGLEIVNRNKEINLETKSLSMDNMTFVDENQKVKVKFIIEFISGERGGDPEDIIIRAIDYTVLIHIK